MTLYCSICRKPLPTPGRTVQARCQCGPLQAVRSLPDSTDAHCIALSFLSALSAQPTHRQISVPQAFYEAFSGEEELAP